MARYPRWLAVVTTPVAFVFVHVLLPYGISRLSTPHGWVGGRPGPVNLLGLLAVASGAGGVAWGAGLHLAETGASFAMESPPGYLLKRGLYRFSRNPIYVGVLTMWLGWAIVYGSVANSVALLVAWAVVTFVVVPFEERGLEQRFGESYLQYKRSVPRWFGVVRT